MSVVTAAARRRWAAVAAGVALLASVPPALARLPADETAGGESAKALAERISRSETVPHEGLAEIRGQLGLPSLPRLDEVTRLIDGTTRARVWWAGPQRWRVATLQPSGERDTAQTRSGPAVWDYDSSTTTFLLGDPSVRLPRTDDLLPPQAARRLLGGLGPFDRVERIAPKRVAGRDAAGLRVVPENQRSSVGEVDIWVDAQTALPLALEVRADDRPEPVLSTSFFTVELRTPEAERTQLPRPPRGRTRTSRTPDLASAVDRHSPWRLPDSLAGLAREEDGGGVGGAATYGKGLTRFVVLSLPADVAGDSITRARAISVPLDLPKGTRGEAIPLHRPLVSVVLARASDGRHAYLLAGTVQPDVLTSAVVELFENPPEER